MIFSEKVEKISSESDKIKEEIDHNMVVGSAASSNTVLTVTGNASARNSNASARINAAVMHCDIDGEKDANGGVTVAISHIDGRERVLGIGGRERGHGHGQTSGGRVSAGRAANVSIATSAGAGTSSGSGGSRIGRLKLDPDDDDDDDEDDDDDDIEGVAITVSSDNGNVVVGGMDADGMNVDNGDVMELEAELAADNDDDDDDNSGSSRNSICDAKDFAETSSSDLMAAALRNDVTAQLAAAGPVGVAAAAAILSAKRYRRSFTFETNPSVRKRQRNRLLRKLKATIDEFTIRVGQQAIILVATPGKPNVCYKVFGAKPLEDVIKNLKSIIMEELDTALAQQAPPTVPEDPTLFELPSLVIDGIPTPVEKMTQAQLRAFIPLMLKYSTGRGKPGWGRESTKPIWWPCEVPWANVRMDARSDEEKQKVPWTHALRQIVLNCYKFHNREDLLPVFNEDDKNAAFKQEIMMMDGQKSILDSIKHENMHSDIYMMEGETNNEDQKLAQQYTPTVIQTIQNADGTVSIIQVDPNNPIITLPDGTTAQVQGIATIQGDGSEENQIQTMQAINEDGTPSEIVEINTVAEATIQDGQIIITGEDGQPYPVSVNGMIIPMQQQMYQTVLANIQQNNDGTFCVSPIASDGKTDGTIETVSVGNGMSQQIMIQSSGSGTGASSANNNNDQAQIMQVLQIKSPILQKSGGGNGSGGGSGGGGGSAASTSSGSNGSGSGANGGNGGSDSATGRNNASGHSGDRRKDSILND